MKFPWFRKPNPLGLAYLEQQNFFLRKEIDELQKSLTSATNRSLAIQLGQIPTKWSLFMQFLNIKRHEIAQSRDCNTRDEIIRSCEKAAQAILDAMEPKIAPDTTTPTP